MLHISLHIHMMHDYKSKIIDLQIKFPVIFPLMENYLIF